jgi:flagellar assembly factor FliW
MRFYGKGAILKISTKAYGVIDVDERQQIVFPEGLYGFEAFKTYVLLDAEQQPYYYLQSVDSQGAAFILLKPFLFRPDYEIDIADEELAAIGIKGPGEALVFAIVTVPSDGSSMTANLAGPIVINRERRIGKQIVLTDPRWKTKHDILKELSENAADGGMPKGGVAQC